MIACSFLAWLGLMALLLALLAVFGARLWSSAVMQRLAKRLCPIACRLAVYLALVGGILLGIWLCRCGPAVWRALGAGGPCLRFIALALLLVVVALVRAIILGAACNDDPKHDPRATTTIARLGAPGLLLLVLVLFLVLLARCCHASLPVLLRADACARLFAIMVVFLLFAVMMWAIHARYCVPPPPGACAHSRRWLYIAALFAALAVLLLWRCCKHLGHKDHDLAMVGIWWDGSHPDEAGVHLRWAFRSDLPFPPGGFDLYRREGGGSWNKLNTNPIRPADVFQDGAPAPGPMWDHRAVDRLHPTRWAHFQGTPFDELRAMLALPPNSDVYFIQEPDDPALPMPASPYVTEAARDAYLAAYEAAGSDAHPATPLAQWQLSPMSVILTMAIDPEIARLVGLLYIDKTAAPDTEYDYRVVGHWADGDRSYTIERVSRPRTAALPAPILNPVTTPLDPVSPAGSPSRDDRAVGLRWDPPTADPDIDTTAADGIRPVRWQPLSKRLGARPCPTITTVDPSFAPPPAPDDDGVVSPVALIPEEDGADLVWPSLFFIDRSVDHACWAYAVQGVDVFGRLSPTSNVQIADVRDLSGPPPPLNVEARVFQRADAAGLAELTAAERDALFPPASTHELALRVSWVWPDDFLTTVPDAVEFRVLHQIAAYASFGPAIWKDPAAWDDAGLAVAVTAGGPLPPRLIDAGVTAARYYEAIVFDPPMTPSDDSAVVYGYTSITAIDHAPWNNRGTPSPPVVIFTRDLVPPAPPPIPSRDGDPVASKGGASAEVKLAIVADARYRYELFHVSGRSLAALPAPTGPVPACLVGEAPTCTGTDATCVEAHRQFNVRRKAVAHPELFLPATPVPGTPTPDGAAFSFRSAHTVDSTAGDDHVYAGRATDPAGNRSSIGCPGLVVVRDSFAPRAPVFTRALGGESQVALTWARDGEPDVVRYRLLRTLDPAFDGSLDRMEVILEVNLAGVASFPPAASNAVVSGAGTVYDTFSWTDTLLAGVDAYYRLVAIDSSGNVSRLSQSMKARSYDTIPPGLPVWSTAPTPGSDATGAFVDLAFGAPPGDADAQIRIQRRQTGSPAWTPLTSWLPAGTTTYRDHAVDAAGAYSYRLQALDRAGNLGERNAPVSTP